MNPLEQKALDLVIKGVPQEEIEQQLNYEFIFFRTPDGKYEHATQWKPLCKTCNVQQLGCEMRQNNIDKY